MNHLDLLLGAKSPPPFINFDTTINGFDVSKKWVGLKTARLSVYEIPASFVVVRVLEGMGELIKSTLVVARFPESEQHEIYYARLAINKTTNVTGIYFSQNPKMKNGVFKTFDQIEKLFVILGYCKEEDSPLIYLNSFLKHSVL